MTRPPPWRISSARSSPPWGSPTPTRRSRETMTDSEEPRPSGPAQRGLAGWRARLIRLLGGALQPDEIRSEASGAAEELVEHAQAFHDLRVEDVMKPRADILALELSCAFEEVVARFAEAEHSRMPVYRETLDNLA